MPAGKAIVADLAQKISWGAIVCVGVAIGAAAARSPKGVGLAGLLSGSAGFYIAKALHKGANQALGIVGPAVAGPSPLLLAGLKALQYGLLGYALSVIGRKDSAGAFAYICMGAISGLLFGGVVIYLFQSSAPLTAPQLVTRAVNELIFPIGCALVLYTAKSFRRS